MTPLRESLAEVLQFMLDAVSGAEPQGMTTGYEQIDHLTGGMRKGSLTVLASLPSLGKTAFALNIVCNSMQKKTETPILYCSNLGNTEIARRVLCIASGVACGFEHDFDRDEIVRITSAAETICDYPLSLHESGTPDDGFLRRIADFHEEKHFGLIVLDPVPASLLSDVRTLARELDVPVLALVSVEKTAGGIPDPDMADMVICLHRSRRPVNSRTEIPVSLVVARNRFGMCGTCRLSFVPQTLQFRKAGSELEEEAEQTTLR